MSDRTSLREWFEENFITASKVPNEVFRRSLFLMLIEGFAQMEAGYPGSGKSKECFRNFILKHSSIRENLKLVCPITLYYDYKDKYPLPEPDVFEGWIYDYTDPHLGKEAERLLLCIPEGKKREVARNNHRYVNLIYQMRSKLVHELHITGTGIDFSDMIPQVASGVNTDVDDSDNIVTTHEASLNIPEKFIAALAWETVTKYLDECEREGRNPIPADKSKRKSQLAWYD